VGLDVKIALGIRQRGCQAALAARTRGDLEQTHRKHRPWGLHLYCAVDVSDPTQVQDMVAVPLSSLRPLTFWSTMRDGWPVDLQENT